MVRLFRTSGLNVNDSYRLESSRSDAHDTKLLYTCPNRLRFGQSEFCGIVVCQSAVNETCARSWNLDFDRFEECRSSTRSTTGFPDFAFTGIMTLALVRTKQRGRSVGVKT